MASSSGSRRSHLGVRQLPVCPSPGTSPPGSIQLVVWADCPCHTLAAAVGCPQELQHPLTTVCAMPALPQCLWMHFSGWPPCLPANREDKSQAALLNEIIKYLHCSSQIPKPQQMLQKGSNSTVPTSNAASSQLSPWSGTKAGTNIFISH